MMSDGGISIRWREETKGDQDGLVMAPFSLPFHPSPEIFGNGISISLEGGSKQAASRHSLTHSLPQGRTKEEGKLNFGFDKCSRSDAVVCQKASVRIGMFRSRSLSSPLTRGAHIPKCDILILEQFGNLLRRQKQEGNGPLDLRRQGL